MAQTASSSDPDDRAGAADDGGHDVAGASDGFDLTAGVVLVDDPAAWPGHLVGTSGGVSTVGTLSTNAAGSGPPAEWQRIETGFLLGYGGASRAAYAADLRDYLTWWADTATPDHSTDPASSGGETGRSPAAGNWRDRGAGTATAPTL